MIPRQYTKKRKSHRDESFQSRTKDLQTNPGNNFFDDKDDFNNDNNNDGNDENNNDGNDENSNDDNDENNNSDEVENRTTESSSTSSTCSRRSNNLSDESSSIDQSDDQTKSRVIDFNSSVLFDDMIDVLRMSQELFELHNLANRIGHEMKEIQISSCDRSRSQYEIAKKLWDWKGNSKLSNEGLKELIEILEWAGVKGLPHINDMMQGVGCIPEVPDLGNIDSLLCFQQCPNSCMVYKGYHSTELQCAVCESPRFAACAKCFGLVCSCLMNRRTPLKTFYYSSLIFYLRDKLSQKTAANFVMALKTEVVKVKDNHINDISDGVSVRKALKDMVSTFEAYCNKKSRELIMVNLVLGGYYDGAQLYKNQVASFWPAGISILNLPPSYRFKEGIGFHLLALFMGKTPSGAEDYLFRSCLGEELKLLKHGIIIADKYFVQARFVISVMDTKAQQHFSRFQSVGSCSACPSCGFRGTFVGKVVYTDHRKYLGWNHAYRAIGQSLQCCPEHQYSTSPQNSKNLAERRRFWTNIESLDPDSEELRYASKIISTSDGMEDIDERKNLAESVCDKEQGGDIDKIFSDIMPDGHDFLFYHNHKKPGSDISTFSYTDFNARMYFVSCYYKDYKRDERTPEEELRTRMQESDEAIFEINRKRRKKLEKPLHELVNPENGCHGSFALSDAPVSIQSFQIWDPFHLLPNLANRLMNLLSGTTVFKIKTIELCKLVGMHPSVAKGNRLGKKGKTLHPWQITQNNMNMIDAVINSCLISSGFGNDFQLRYLFKQGGYLNSASKIQLLVIMLPVLAAFSELPKAYKQFIRMLHHDIVYLFRPFFEGPEEIDMLFLLVVETVVTYEGLFPISEHTHAFHQLVCLVKQLKEFGPIRNLMGAIMERALKSIKSVNPNGGQSPFLTQLRKYMALTKQRHGRAFRFKIRRGKIISSSHVRRARKMHREINDPCFISAARDGDAYHIRYNDAKVCLWNEASARRCEKVMMDHEKVETFFEQSLFIEALLHEIKRQGEEGNSSLYKASTFLREEMSTSTSIVWKTLAAVEKSGGKKADKQRRVKFSKALVCWIYFVATGRMHTQGKQVIPHPEGLEKIFIKMHGDEVAEYKSTFTYIYDIFTKEVKYYRNANAYGIRINSHLASLDANFADCSESGQRIFDEHKIASSFCKYHDQESKPRYGLCQYFFRVVCPSDKVIHGMPLARVLQINTFTNDIIPEDPKLSGKTRTCREIVKFGLTGILVENASAMEHKGLALCPDDCCQFVPLTQFFSTSVILIPLDTEYKPMLHKIKRRSYAMKAELQDQKVISRTNEIGMFYVIDFHPERSVYVYSKTNNEEYNNMQNDY